MNNISTKIAVGWALIIVGVMILLYWGYVEFYAEEVPKDIENQQTVAINETTKNIMKEEEQNEAGIIVKSVTEGVGETADVGDTVAVHYTGKLEDGTVFDSSRDRGVPLEFTLGKGQMIAGFDQGVRGMKVGGTRTIVIPPELAYGATGVSGAIPPNATIIFEVELMTIK